MVRFPAGTKKFLFSKSPICRLLKSIQPPVERVAGTLSLEGSGRGPNLTARLHLVTRLRTSGAVFPFHHSILVVHQDTLTSYLCDRSVGELTAGLGNVEHRKSLLLPGIEIRLSSPSLSLRHTTFDDRHEYTPTRHALWFLYATLLQRLMLQPHVTTITPWWTPVWSDKTSITCSSGSDEDAKLPALCCEDCVVGLNCVFRLSSSTSIRITFSTY